MALSLTSTTRPTIASRISPIQPAMTDFLSQGSPESIGKHEFGKPLFDTNPESRFSLVANYDSAPGRGFILFRFGFLRGGRTSVLPPLAAIFSAADLEKWCAFTVRRLVKSPSPRTRKHSLAPLTTPRSLSVAASTVAPSSKQFSWLTLTMK